MTRIVDWKKAVLVGLVIVLVLAGLPVLMPGMGGAHCPDCGSAVSAAAVCLLVAVLASVVATPALRGRRIGVRPDDLLSLVRATVFERPPRLA